MVLAYRNAVSMCCFGTGRGRAGPAWLATGPILNARVKPWRVPLRGPAAEEQWPLIIESEAVGIVQS
jgi:hypothetical protein